ncbi:ImmA/IrrE family metallo-endopeptidase [Bartonella sp. B17]
MSKSLDYEVLPRRWAEIDNIANKLRKKLRLSHDQPFPILNFVEFCLPKMMPDLSFYFWIREKKEMESTEGLTHPQGKYIAIRRDVYEKACYNDGRSNFTIAHELGHFMLHTNLPFQRIANSRKIATYCSAEKQANHFAAALLMSREFILQQPTIDEIMKNCGVSRKAAETRYKKVNGFEPKLKPTKSLR